MHKTVGQSDPRLVWKYVSRIQDNPGINTVGSWTLPVYARDSQFDIGSVCMRLILIVVCFAWDFKKLFIAWLGLFMVFWYIYINMCVNYVVK